MVQISGIRPTQHFHGQVFLWHNIFRRHPGRVIANGDVNRSHGWTLQNNNNNNNNGSKYIQFISIWPYITQRLNCVNKNKWFVFMLHSFRLPSVGPVGWLVSHIYISLLRASFFFFLRLFFFCFCQSCLSVTSAFLCFCCYMLQMCLGWEIFAQIPIENSNCFWAFMALRRVWNWSHFMLTLAIDSPVCSMGAFLFAKRQYGNFHFGQRTQQENIANVRTPFLEKIVKIHGSRQKQRG